MVPLTPVVIQANLEALAPAILSLLLTISQLAGMWMVFAKANRAGWKAIIPIYNFYVMLKIGDNAWWWLPLVFVPIINLYALYKIHVGVARTFGKGVIWGLGLAFLGFFFFPVLGFGDDTYQH